jgi:thioester reductase-like protein
MKRKVKIVTMDLAAPDLGLLPQVREELIQNLNIIINCAGTVEFDTRLDIATRINVTGPLKLIELAQQCPNFEVFA